RDRHARSDRRGPGGAQGRRPRPRPVLGTIPGSREGLRPPPGRPRPGEGGRGGAVRGAPRPRRLAGAGAAGVVLAGAAWWTSARAGGQAGDRDPGAEVGTATAAVTRRDPRATGAGGGT